MAGKSEPPEAERIVGMLLRLLAARIGADEMERSEESVENYQAEVVTVATELLVPPGTIRQTGMFVNIAGRALWMALIVGYASGVAHGGSVESAHADRDSLFELSRLLEKGLMADIGLAQPPNGDEEVSA